MSEKMSTGLCNHLMSGGSLKNAFEGAASEIRIYAGTPPATADAALSGNTLLSTIKNNGAAITFEAAASGGVLLKNSTETWNCASNAATGTATFYRLVNSSDDGSASTTAKRIQGTVGVGGADMNLGNTALVAAAPFTLNFFSQALVPS